MKINWTRLVEIDCKAQLIKVYFLYTALVPNSTETELDAWRERLHTLDFCASDHHFNNCLSSSLPALTRKHQSLCRCPLFTHTLQRDTFTWTYIWGNWTLSPRFTRVFQADSLNPRWFYSKKLFADVDFKGFTVSSFYLNVMIVCYMLTLFLHTVLLLYQMTFSSLGF